ncbi:MAG: hypothetical protein DRN05_05900 [Thermoplasmata archaeon]|nr:MAG: hypothetical protein DRN05_05900 [Thermoplasmata archaeon]
MREYKIKKGHNPNIEKLINKYFGVKGDIHKGFKFKADGIGEISIKQEKNSLFIEINPTKNRCSDFGIIKKWNNFLLEATGKDAKERKKELTKIK